MPSLWRGGIQGEVEIKIVIVSQNILFQVSNCVRPFSSILALGQAPNMH